eukprot:3535831-Amphidinium_carterae.1
MSRIERRSLTREEGSLLLQCGSFWPDSMVDRSSFMKMLLHVLTVEGQRDIQPERWEEELNASGVCDAFGVVDVKHFVSREMWKSIGRVAILRVLAKSKFEDSLLATTRFVVSHGAEWELPAPVKSSNEMLDVTNTKRGGPRNPDRSLTLSSLQTAVIGEQTPLPLPKDQAGAMVVVDSKHYVLGEKLGHGAGGSVFAATLKREAVDVHARGESDSNDPDSMALKLVGGVGDADRRGADTRLGFVAVEAVAAAE